MIEFKIGRYDIPVDSVESLIGAIKHESKRQHRLNANETALLIGLASFIERLHSISLVDAVGFTMVTQPPAPDTLSISVLFPLTRGNESVTQAFQEVIKADGQLAHATIDIMPMNLSFFNSQKIDASKMRTILEKRGDGGENFIGMAVFRRL